VPQVLLALCRCAGPDTRRRFYQLSLLDSLLQELRLELDMFCDMVGGGRGLCCDELCCDKNVPAL
jgi:hypothetical protein